MTHTAQGPWQRLLNLARPQKNRLIVGTIFLAIGSGLGLLYPQAVRIIIDDALGNRDLELIKNAALGLIAVFALQGVAIGLRAYLFTIAGEHVVTNLRNDLFSRIVSQELAFFDENKTGELTSRLASDTQVLQNAVGVNISMGLRFLASGMGALGLALLDQLAAYTRNAHGRTATALGTVWVAERFESLHAGPRTRSLKPTMLPRKASPICKPFGHLEPRATRVIVMPITPHTHSNSRKNEPEPAQALWAVHRL